MRMIAAPSKTYRCSCDIPTIGPVTFDQPEPKNGRNDVHAASGGAHSSNAAAHHSHHHLGHAVVDPVCGMTVDPKTAQDSFEHAEETYHLSSAGCRTKFAAAPETYLHVSRAAEAQAPLPEGTIYSCPMHPQIIFRNDSLRNDPGDVDRPCRRSTLCERTNIAKILGTCEQIRANIDNRERGRADMPISRPLSLIRSVRARCFKLILKCGYRIAIRKGGWWRALKQVATPHPGEQILEVSAEGFSACAVLARDYPTVHFTALQSAEPNKIAGNLISNLELLHGDQCGIDCRAASFDKIICSLALHPLPQNGKLAFLKEMRRVLRRGGTLYLADLDQPLQPRETYVFRATGHLFGHQTAKSHYDGTWLNLFKQAGFVGVRRVSSFSEIVGRVTIVRARRD